MSVNKNKRRVRNVDEETDVNPVADIACVPHLVPVTIDAALTVVMVGNMECVSVKCTPFFIRAASAGAV
jgi:hypothetical protein